MAHAVVYPYPSQGHINPMYQLVSTLLDRGFYITFINTEYNHERILKNGASEGLLSSPNLRFVVIPDGLPPQHGRLTENVTEFMQTIDTVQPSLLEKLVKEIVGAAAIPVTCIISDSMCSWMQKVADAVNLPRVVLWTTPVHASLAYCCFELLRSKGFVPYKGQENPSRLITCIPGLPPLLASDMITFFETEDFSFHWTARHFTEMPAKAQWNLGNNIYELEKDATDEFGKQHVRSFLPVGPLLPPSYFDSELTVVAGSTSLCAADANCEEWLDKQDNCSVLYVSFGSIVHMRSEQVEEVALGLEASGHAFLWVLRSNVDAATRSKIQAFQERTQGRGLVVTWAPQLSVLSHPSVGAFLTHCGWNSLTEGMSAGLPIIAWPGGFGEQPMNVRYVVDIWKIGTELKAEETHDGQTIVSRMAVERAVKVIMASTEGAQLRKRALEVKQIAKVAVAQGGSSHQNLDRFVKAMMLLAQDCSTLA